MNRERHGRVAMSEDGKHTPSPASALPWEIYYGNDNVGSADGHVAAFERPEDAAFVVSCVNSHAALVARVEELECKLFGFEKGS